MFTTGGCKNISRRMQRICCRVRAGSSPWLKRWLLGTHQGAVGADYLQDYLDEFTFRFNRRTSASRGKLFFRLARQAVQIAPTTYEALGKHNL